ncbi:MAG TPA: acyl-CoA dehydrogenase family protein [Acidimicrobiia bacterium]|nr:acyl-CoA dehydrogenase family protein [Acidimicrobiia bacterium]
MALVSLDAGLSDADVALRDTVHRFAAEVMRPVGRELDRMADPADVIAPSSPLWHAFDRYRQLGLDATAEPETDADPAHQALVSAVVNEELGWGDAGLAISFGVSNFHRLFARMSGDQELIDRFCTPSSREIGCWAVTEPDHGSDSLTFTERHWRDPALHANCVARRKGDDFVINGQKSAWVSNGSIATVAALFCTIDDDKGFENGGVALVPLDRPGVSRGRPLDKLGQRALNQGEIIFDDVHIPASYMLIGPELYAFTVEAVLALANSAMGSCFVGCGRAALELALDYAQTRVQGGVPIAQHQSVKGRLFRMFSRVEAARSLARRVAVYNGANPPLVQYSIASKTFCTSTAFEVASDALQIFGGNGLTREYPIEKIMRDARASMIEDGCNEVLSIVGAAKLYEQGQ